MAGNANGVRLITGSLDFSGGVNSGRVTTIESASMPGGLKANQLAWLTNGTVRGGGVTTRTGFKPLVQGAKWSGLYQGGWLYEPDFAFPYLVLQIGGRIYQVRVDSDNSVHDLSQQFNLTQPPLVDQAFMEQGEQFLVVQAGDIFTSVNPTPPLFWDGTTLKRSKGFIGPNNPLNQIPAAGPMDYYQGRLWYSQGRIFSAGDIVRGPSGTLPFSKRDSILNVTENPLGAAGDGFTVPTNAGNIRALWHPAELDTAFGQGQLLIGTTRQIYRLNVPITRDAWTKADNNTGIPFQTVAQEKWGPVGERSIVLVNGDIFYQSLEPGIRSFVYAVRYFQQWGNTPLSRPVNRVLAFNDRSLLRFSTGIDFNNRLLQSALPYQTPVGVAHRGILPLDFDLLNDVFIHDPPCWEGMLEGIQVLQLFEGDYGGVQRAFAVTVSDLNGQIEVWELTSSDRFDKQVGTDGNRINWFLETPSYTWGDPFKLKRLDSAELWIDKLAGSVTFRVQYRPDQWPCWIDWHEWKECQAKSCAEDLEAVSCAYPSQPFCEGFRATMTLPKPKPQCIQSSGRPSDEGYQFQFRLNVKGWCRVRGILGYALPLEKPPYQGIPC